MAHMAKLDQQERKVNVKRTDLVEALKTNLEKHLKEYEEAVQAYKTLATERLNEEQRKATEKLDKHYRKALEKISEFDPESDGNTDYFELVPHVVVTMKIPRNYSEEYKAAIDMFRWDTRDEVELSYAEFNCFVRDKWDWTSDFKFVNETYTKAVSRF